MTPSVALNKKTVIALAAAIFVVSISLTLLPASDATLNRQLRDRIDRAPLETRRPNPAIKTVGHRGANRFAPENTLVSIRKALELGFDYVELDVRETRDGVPVVLHDSSVDRTTDGTGDISELTFAEARQLDAGSWYNEAYTGERIPSLEEALQAISGHACVLWDTKAMPTATMVELFARYGFDRDCLIITAGGLGRPDNDELLSKLLQLWPDAPIMPQVKSMAELSARLEAYPQIRAVRLLRSNFKPELIDAAHAEGLLLLTSTLEQVDTGYWHNLAIDSGLDLIMLSDIAGFQKARVYSKP